MTDVPIPTDPSVVWGIDISGMWDGVIDYAKLKARGGRFAVIKVADGTLRAKLYLENVLAAQAQGLVVGGYCWLYRTERVSAHDQASAWWNIVKDLNLDFVAVDYEWTKWNGQQDNPNHSDLDAVMAEYKKLSGKELWIYSAPGYLSQYPITLGTRKLWIANYGVPAPSTSLPYVMWQCSESWDGSQLGADPNYSHALDGDIFHGTLEQFNNLFKEIPVEVYIVTRSLKDYSVEFTQGVDALPLVNSLKAAIDNGWESAMNGGAGFTYINKEYGQPKIDGFQTVMGIPYARRLVTDSVINPNLSDNNEIGPWSILGFLGTDVYLIVTTGLEGISGMTQMRAADYCASVLGLEDAYLMDSGRSCQIEDKGTMLYWPYGPDELVPQHIGLKKRTGDTVTTYTGKVKALLGVVVRREDGTKIATLSYGTTVHGDSLSNRGSAAPWSGYTWMHITSPNVGYVAVQNLTYSADTVTPPPTGVTLKHTILVYSDGSVTVDGNPIP